MATCNININCASTGSADALVYWAKYTKIEIRMAILETYIAKNKLPNQPLTVIHIVMPY